MSTPEPDPKQIFAEALGLTDPGRREAYLDGACGRDTTLRREIESLLGAHEQAGTFLAKSIQFHQSNLAGEQPAMRIGRYKLLEQIGEGGFGVVWMAEQEEPVRRRVALKIIKLGMDSREVVARFEAERQALAMMDHPNIASVFDGGATETGRPYFVMELVKGIPITQFCDEQKLSTQERLELFMQVCQAVQHAHQKGIIHRDLKPSNVLVTVKDDRPVPKVIDFGVAKATQARLTEKTVFTRFHQWIGTPAYMSPEQAGLGSLDVDTRGDVYSLGVLLYELLTGRTPFDTQELLNAGYEAVMRTIREQEPPKPSTRLSSLTHEELTAVAKKRGAEPAKLGRVVRGDLDWIVMKALEKDRQRRYDTAASLAQDVERHLQAQPVSAVAPSTIYRLKKFSQRNRLALAASSTVAVTLVAATLISFRSASVAWKASEAASRERDRASSQTRIAELNAEESRLRLLNLNTAHGLQLLDRGDWFGAALWFCDALGRTRTNAPAEAANRLRLGVILSYAPQLSRLWMHGAAVTCAAFSPDRSRVVAASRDGLVRIWDLASDKPVGTAMPHAGSVLSAQFSPDGQYVVTACEDRTARVWDAASGKAVAPPLVHRLPLRAAMFLPDGRHVVTACSSDGWVHAADGGVRLRHAESEVRLWDTISGLEARKVYSRATNLTQLLTGPAGRGIAAAYGDGEVRILNDRLMLDVRLGGSPSQSQMQMVPGGTVLQFGSTSAPPELQGVALPENTGWFSPHAGAVNGLAFSSDGAYLASAGTDGEAWIHSITSVRSRRICRGGGDPGTPGPSLQQVAFSPDGQLVATLAGDGTVAFWSVPRGQAASHLNSPLTGAKALIFSPDGRYVAVTRAAASGAGEVRLWEVLSGRAATPALPHAGAVSDVAFSPDGSLLLTGSLDGGVRVWDLTAAFPSVPPLTDAKEPDAAPTNAMGWDPSWETIFSSDGKRVATLSDAGTARIWDAANSQPISAVIMHFQQTPVAAFNKDASRIAIAGGSGHGHIRVFDTTTGTNVWQVARQTDSVCQIAFSPDDRCLVVSDASGINILDAVSGEAAFLPIKLSIAVRGLAFSPDNRWVATCTAPSIATDSAKQTWQIRVWQRQTGEAITPTQEVGGIQPERLGGHTPQMVFSDNGRWLAVSSQLEESAPQADVTHVVTHVYTLEVRQGGSFGQPLEFDGLLSQLFFAPHSDHLLMMGGTSGLLKIRDLARGENRVLRQPQDHDYRPRQISKDGRWLLESAQGGWRLWDVASCEPATPVLGSTPGEVLGTRGDGLAPDGAAVVGGRSLSPQLWPLLPDQRPLESMICEVQLLAARELDASGNIVPLTPNRLSNVWQAVRAASLRGRELPTGQITFWHLHQAGQSELASQWFAAEFHLSRLMGTLRDGPQTRRRLAHARAQAAFEILNRKP